MASTSTKPGPALPVLPEPVTLCALCYHKGGPYEYMDSCQCDLAEDPCDCACACDEEQMAQKAISFPDSVFWTVKPLEEIQRLLAKAARWKKLLNILL